MTVQAQQLGLGNLLVARTPEHEKKKPEVSPVDVIPLNIVIQVVGSRGLQ